MQDGGAGTPQWHIPAGIVLPYATRNELNGEVPATFTLVDDIEAWVLRRLERTPQTA